MPWTSIVRAGFTPILDSPDQHNEPNLLGTNPFPGNLNPLVLETLYGEQNLRRVDDSQDHRFRHTGNMAVAEIVAKFSGVSERFGFLRDDGNLMTVLQARDRRGSGYHPEVFSSSGSSGMIDPAESGEVFVVGMRDIPAWSLPRLNLTGSDQLVTFEIIGNVGHPENSIGDFVLGFEDTPPNYGTLTYDGDFQDMVVELSGVALVPEPGGILLTWIGIVVCFVCRGIRVRYFSIPIYLAGSSSGYQKLNCPNCLFINNPARIENAGSSPESVGRQVAFGRI